AEHLRLIAQKGVRPQLPGIYDRFDGPLKDLKAKNLSFGDRRVLELAMALAREPELLLLDEPTAGLTRADAQSLVPILRTVREQSRCAMIIVEHDMNFVTDLADVVTVLHQGAVLTSGSMEDVAKNAEVRQAYLGSK